jgi:hypothetical protein
MTSSMPWNESSGKLQTAQHLRVGGTGKTGKTGNICDKDATNFLPQP